jgi:hypothetical protein
MTAGEGSAQMDLAAKDKAFREVPRKFAAGEKVDPKDWQGFVDAQNDGLKTGPKVGETVPDFRLPDQNGKEWTLGELSGPKGLLLVFVRSADW